MQDAGLISMPQHLNAQFWFKTLPCLIGGLCFSIGGYLSWSSAHKSFDLTDAQPDRLPLTAPNLYLVVRSIHAHAASCNMDSFEGRMLRERG